MRALAVKGAELVVVPQAGAVGEWPEGLYEAEMRVAAFQNGYFAALCNRVGPEECLTFGGESFVCAPNGNVIARAPAAEDTILYADVDLPKVAKSHARRLFLRDRRPELYGGWIQSQYSLRLTTNETTKIKKTRRHKGFVAFVPSVLRGQDT